ncbi:hypothetical protein CMV30_07810 [Nibricoccus aquaticus]|uniref:Vitamin K epoxide reductase domain-containing protein n=1 Tax=Nibricoccus aquaticus TaxID=2576891 RepID=A0A290Q598_9BACT|nr:vitamin K epoxide reductase family protein [Nibricoccus aquaticus]ATC63859.1 hypothetical protein CMV30_07810 [Nibricoccus aquaticus]
MSARPALTQLLIVAGLALSAYLAALKFLALPCLGAGGCHTILHSRYGEIFRLPVGLYGTLLWLAVILVPDRSKRGMLLLLMSGGSVIFMLLQFAVLRSFCLYCTLHALITWAVLWLHAETPRRWTAPLGLALATGALLLTRHQIATTAATPASSSSLQPSTFNLQPSASSSSQPSALNSQQSPPAASSADPSSSHSSPFTLHASSSGLYWLGPFTEKSPALILSLDCPACLDLLESLTQRAYENTPAGPALYFKTTDANRALTETFLAAVLSQDSTPRDAFLSVTTLLLTQKDLALNSPATASQQLAAQFPAASTRLIHARRILADQTLALQSAALAEATPLFLPREGTPRAFFPLEALFPR